MQTAHALKELVKRHKHLHYVLREAKIKWGNYFSYMGEVPRRINNFLSGFDPELQGKLRSAIAKQLGINADEKTRQFVEQLSRDGYAVVRFEDLGVSPEEALLFLDTFIAAFKEKEHDQSEFSKLQSGDYGGKPLSYHLYKKNIDDDNMDPLMSLVTHPKLIQIASMYLGYLPMIGFTSLMFTPVHTGAQFGAQLWHRDLHHARCLKLFFSPIKLDVDQGPFEFFHPKFSTLKYYKYFPQSMTDEQIDQQGLSPSKANMFVGGRGEVLFVDTTRCLHRGGRTSKKARYIATTIYCPPTHSFTSKEFRQTEHYDFPFRLYKKENEELLAAYS